MKPEQNIPLLARFIPFLMMGLMIVLFIIGLFIFSYILIFAAIVGFVLFVISAIRARFFNKGKTHTYQAQFEAKTGRTIEYEDESDNKQG